MKEEEIRPQDIFDEYLRLCEQDIATYFSDAPRHTTECPACGTVGLFAFEKNGFRYDECPACFTLFVSERPEKETFDRYYTDSPSTKYWATTFYRQTEESRRLKLWKPKAKLLLSKVAAYGAPGTVVDIGGGYGTFAEEIRALGQQVVVIEPSRHLAAVCRGKGLLVIEKFLEGVDPQELPAGPRCFASFELFEHLYEPAEFLQSIGRLMGEGDLFVFTTLSGTGVDIRVLWEQSKSVSPPHHLNFFNPHSVKTLLDRVGFLVEEVTTPGKLDVDIMANSLPAVKDRFWSSFLAMSDEAARQRMQESLAQNLLSSHMMVVCRRKG